MNMNSDRRKLFIVRTSVAVWIIMLLPFAMSAKAITSMACLCFVAAAVGFAVKPSRRWSTWLTISFSAFLATFTLPVDFAFHRGEPLRLSWVAVDIASIQPLREPDMVLGIKPRWILRLAIPY